MNEPDFTVTETDVGKTIAGVCKDAHGNPVTLAGATSVKFRLGLPGKTVLVFATATADADQTANKGLVSFNLPTEAVADVGRYDAQFVVEWGSSQRRHFPTKPLVIAVVRQAADA